jgi:hypothetical protein
VSLQQVEQPGGASLPRRPPPPGDGVRAWLEPQPPAGHHGRQPADHQAEPGHYQAAEDSAGGTDAEAGGHPPGQAPGPDGPLARPGPPPPGLGRAARPTHRGLHPHRHHRPIGAGASQEPIGIVGELGENGLQVGLAERPHRPAGPVIVVEGPRSGTGHRELLPGAANRRPALGLVGHAARGVAVGWCARWSAAVAGAVGGSLPGLEALDGRAGPLPIGPLAWAIRLGAKRPL